MENYSVLTLLFSFGMLLLTLLILVVAIVSLAVKNK